jgi:hypothetical protein
MIRRRSKQCDENTLRACVRYNHLLGGCGGTGFLPGCSNAFGVQNDPEQEVFGERGCGNEERGRTGHTTTSLPNALFWLTRATSQRRAVEETSRRSDDVRGVLWNRHQDTRQRRGLLLRVAREREAFALEAGAGDRGYSSARYARPRDVLCLRTRDNEVWCDGCRWWTRR